MSSQYMEETNSVSKTRLDIRNKLRIEVFLTEKSNHIENISDIDKMMMVSQSVTYWVTDWLSDKLL